MQTVKRSGSAVSVSRKAVGHAGTVAAGGGNAAAGSQSPLNPSHSKGHSMAIKLIQKKIEKITNDLMVKYTTTHSIKLQRNILLLLSTLVKEGVSIKQLEQCKNLLQFLEDQVLGKKSYLKAPPDILSFIYDFISILSIYFPDLIPFKNIEYLSNCVFFSPYWSIHGNLLPCINNLLFNLFSVSSSSHHPVQHLPSSPSPSSPSSPSSSSHYSLDTLRDYFFEQIMQKIHLVYSIDCLISILSIVKNRNHDIHITYSTLIFNSLIPLLSSSSSPASSPPSPSPPPRPNYSSILHVCVSSFLFLLPLPPSPSFCFPLPSFLLLLPLPPSPPSASLSLSPLL